MRKRISALGIVLNKISIRKILKLSLMDQQFEYFQKNNKSGCLESIRDYSDLRLLQLVAP